MCPVDHCVVWVSLWEVWPPTTLAGAPPRIHRVILLDREVDLVTPLMTQITLEGLIDEVTGIRAGAVPWAPRGEPGAGNQ
jgi:hypothetical protein